jgi:hypothetical protein
VGDILNASDWWNSQKGTDVDQWEGRGGLKINFWADRRSQKFRSSDILFIYLFIYLLKFNFKRPKGVPWI